MNTYRLIGWVFNKPIIEERRFQMAKKTIAKKPMPAKKPAPKKK